MSRLKAPSLTRRFGSQTMRDGGRLFSPVLPPAAGGPRAGGLEISAELFSKEFVEPPGGLGVLGPLGDVFPFVRVGLVVVELPAGRAPVPIHSLARREPP